jgi:hypothetical protein
MQMGLPRSANATGSQKRDYHASLDTCTDYQVVGASLLIQQAFVPKIASRTFEKHSLAQEFRCPCVGVRHSTACVSGRGTARLQLRYMYSVFVPGKYMPLCAALRGCERAMVSFQCPTRHNNSILATTSLLDSAPLASVLAYDVK